MVIKAKEGRGVDRGKTLDIVVNQSLAEIPRINIFTHPVQTSAGKHCHCHLYRQLYTVINSNIPVRVSITHVGTIVPQTVLVFEKSF